MKLPDGNTFRDVTSTSNLPPTTAADIAAYLLQHGAMLDASALQSTSTKLGKKLYVHLSDYSNVVLICV